MAQANTHFSALTRKLHDLARLDHADEQALHALPFSIQKVGAAANLVREGQRPDHCCLLVDGYACRYKVSATGGRQIVSFHIAGDVLDVQHLYLASADHDIQTITEATIAWVPKAALQSLIRDRPAIGEALWKDTLIDASIFREWVLNVGRRDAKARIAHMLCEFAARCEAAGLAKPQQLQIPLTQEQIADATGLTSVHVNRTLQKLSGCIQLEGRGRNYRITDWNGLQRIASFDAGYLHQAAA